MAAARRRVATGRAATKATAWSAPSASSITPSLLAAADNRNKQPDPNSPFAKLAALKQQLEQNGKES